MPIPITEFFNGGLVTARAGSLLEPGELQQADDCIYRLYDPAIQRAPGRTIYNSTTLKTTPTGSTPAGIKGLAQLTFDGNTDQLIAWPAGDGTNSYLYKSNFTGITGSFSIITGPGTIANCVTNGTTTVTAPAGSFTNMVAGIAVTGTNIATGTYISVVVSDTNITLSKAATGSGTVTLAFDGGISFSLSDVGDEILDVVQWENSYFILPKRGTVNRLSWRTFGDNEVLQIRPAGLLPITQAATFSVQSGVGWSGVLGIGFYWFLVTELLSFDQGQTIEAEAGYVANEGRPSVIEITNHANQFVRVTFPTIKNDGTNGTNRATHWGIYMSIISPGKAAYPDKTNVPSLATFRRVMVVPIDDTTKDLRFNNTTQGPSLPTTSAAVPGVGEFTNPTGVFTRGGIFATSTSAVKKANAFAGFGFSSGSPFNTYTVTGIQVRVVARTESLRLHPITIQLDNASTKVSIVATGIVAFDRFNIYTFGGQFNNWGVAWTPTDIGSLRVIVQKDALNTTRKLDVDYIEVVVHYTGATVDTGSINLDGPPYQVVTYRSQIGTTVNDPANYIIPSASTGDVFQGSLVLNDTNDPSVIRYSLPGRPESMPKPYFMKFDSKKKDIVTLVKKLGQILIVGMRDSIKRVNYLPTETDVNFQRGTAHEDIVIDHGIVGPLAATLFDISGSGVVLAYVGYNGFYFTDGITTRPFNLDIKIQNLTKSSALGTSVLRIYPREKWLVFYYCPNAASHTKNTRAIVFSYDPAKIKEGGFLPALGPISISARSASEASLAGVPYLLTGHQSDGKVYVEDSGNVQATSYQVHNNSDSLVDAPIIPIIRTRKIYPSGYSRDAREQRIYVLYSAAGSTFSVSSTLTSGSPNVTSAAGFTNVLRGMFVTGTGISPGTIVITKTDNSNIVLSANAEASGTQSLTFDDGTIAATMRGSGIMNDIFDFDTFYLPTTVGDLLVMHHDNMEQALELKISKVTLPSGSTVDLNQEMKLYNWTFLAEDGGTEQNRAD